MENIASHKDKYIIYIYKIILVISDIELIL